VATARNPGTISDLGNYENCIVIELDVCSSESINRALKVIRDEGISIEVLVNNAGYGYYGPLEEAGPDVLSKQFETNVFGLMKLTAGIIPSMRERESGRIINVSSVVGRVSFPYVGVYSSSKFALEALSSALRGELKNWSIRVIVINPGPVSTKFAVKSRGAGLDILKENSPYWEYYSRLLEKVGTGKDEHNHKGMDVVQAAEILYHACVCKNPKNRYNITRFARFMPLLKWILPERLFEIILWKKMKI